MPDFEQMKPEERGAVLTELRKALGGEYGYLGPSGERIQKDATNQLGVVTGLGLLGYPLEAPAKLLYPVPTPLRNRLPRQTTGGKTRTFRKITGINTTNIWGSVAEASDSTTGRNSRIAYNEADVTVTYKGIEQETMLTPEAMFGGNSSVTPGQNFNAQEFGTVTLLQSTMLAEEKILLGGNITALGTPPTCTKTGVTQLPTGIGSLTAATSYYFSISALTIRAYLAGAQGQVAAVDAPGETTAAEVTIATTSGGTAGDKSVTLTWNAIYGAVAYNVFAGSSTGIANHHYSSTVFKPYATVSVISAGNRPNAADQTANALDYDGLIPMASASTAGYRTQIAVSLTDGTGTLTSDSAGGVNEIDVLFKTLFDTYKVSPDELWVGTAVKKKIDQIIAGQSAPVLRIDAKAGDMSITGSIGVKSIMNRYMNEDVPITVHPFLPPGCLIAANYTMGPYYPNANFSNNLLVSLGWDYRKIDFALAKRAWETGIDLFGALVCYAPFSLASIWQIG